MSGILYLQESVILKVTLESDNIEGKKRMRNGIFERCAFSITRNKEIV